MFLWMVKSLDFIVKTNNFEGLAGCVRERKRYQQTSKNILKSNTKSMTNPCKIHARKSDAKNMTKHYKLSQKGNWNPSQIEKIQGPRIHATKKCVYAMTWRGRRVGRGAPSNILNVSNRLNVHTLCFLAPLRYTHRPETSPDVNLSAQARVSPPFIL